MNKIYTNPGLLSKKIDRRDSIRKDFLSLYLHSKKLTFLLHFFSIISYENDNAIYALYIIACNVSGEHQIQNMKLCISCKHILFTKTIDIFGKKCAFYLKMLKSIKVGSVRHMS